MSKFIINNYSGGGNNNNPVLQADSITTSFERGVMVNTVTNGILTDGKVMLPVSGTVRRHDDGRITVNGNLIDWQVIAGQQQQQQQQNPKLPNAMPNEPPVKDGEKECTICMTRSIKTIIVDCGHPIYCITCARDCVRQGTTCPVCRTPVTHVIRQYEA